MSPLNRKEEKRTGTEKSACLVILIRCKRDVKIFMTLECPNLGSVPVWNFPTANISISEQPFDMALRGFYKKTGHVLNMIGWNPVTKFTCGSTRFYVGEYTIPLKIDRFGSFTTRLINIDVFHKALQNADYRLEKYSIDSCLRDALTVRSTV